MAVVEDAFAAMVDQFKDPFAFLRELIQNALDAGSTRIDVDVRRDGSIVTIEVQDTGEGMDREIIETKLTRLFASSKSGDATKIGKFGVGFSSVFSTRPEAVVVDTARGAERWRVLFASAKNGVTDGSWQLFALDEAIEGTRVRVLKRVANDTEATHITSEARRTVSKWCRYARADIYFCGAPMVEEFTLPCPIIVRVPSPSPGDVVIVGLGAKQRGSPWGFYNKGLTLLEGDGPFQGVPSWVSFRVLDGALEHTITRDNVIRDDAFERVLATINEAAHGPLLELALEALESEHAEHDAICAALVAPLAAKLLDKPAARAKRRVLRDARGGGVSMDAVRTASKNKRVARVDGPGALVDALEKDGALVVQAGAGSGAAALLVALGGPAAAAHDEHIAILGALQKEQWQAAPLLASLKALLPSVPALASVTEVMVGRVEDRLQVLTDVPALLARDAALPIARTRATWLPGSTVDKRDAPRVLLLNLACPAMGAALALSSTDVWLAAFLALRLALPAIATADGATAMVAWRARSSQGDSSKGDAVLAAPNKRGAR